MSIYLLATLDTKGREADFVRQRLVSQGLSVTLVDVGSGQEPMVEADIDREAVFAAAGTSLADVQAAQDRGHAVSQATIGAAELIKQNAAEGKVTGVFGLGGSAGTAIGTSAMRSLPLGVPKLMISTMASGNVRPYVGDKDILMMNSIVDIAGINRISRLVLSQAADAMAGMVNQRTDSSETPQDEKPLIAASMFGVTTPCVQIARSILEEAGFEVLVFHATGNGGQAMESLIRDGLIAGVLDVTTTELADELVGGVLTAGPDRLTAAAKCDVPQVVSVGATDMVNFGAPDTVPPKFKDRLFYQHNPVVTLMRTTEAECRELGETIGSKTAAAPSTTRLLFPKQGVSAIDHTEQPFDDPAARQALLDGIEATRGETPLEICDAHINDESFARQAAATLLTLIQQPAK